MIKSKHVQQAFDDIVHFWGVRGVGISVLPTRRRKDSDNDNDKENGLRMRNEKEKLKEKRFSFFADPQERKAKTLPTFGTLPFARHASQRFAKVKEPNLAHAQKTFIKQNICNFTVCLTN